MNDYTDFTIEFVSQMSSDDIASFTPDGWRGGFSAHWVATDEDDLPDGDTESEAFTEVCELVETIQGATKSLKQLAAAMRTGMLERWHRYDELPTFGGAEPFITQGVWSWDETHLLIGEGVDDLAIVARLEWTS